MDQHSNDNRNHHNDQMGHDEHSKEKGNYLRLLIMAILSFISMYFLMYAMIDVFGSFYNHLNQVYMALLMASPMIIFELFLMKSMYKDSRKNAIFLVVSLLVGVLSFVAIRQQTAIGDAQFLRSMIPHHSGAILMCEEASITDSEIQDLCLEIIDNQQFEIDQMKSILERLKD